MKIKQLYEAFSQSYNVRQFGSNRAFFQTDDGNTYSITTETVNVSSIKDDFERTFKINLTEEAINEPHITISFAQLDDSGRPIEKYGQNSEDMNYESNPVKVFSTVFNFINRIIENTGYPVYTFQGENKLGSLYMRLLRNNTPYGYRTFANQKGNIIEFGLVKEDYIA